MNKKARIILVCSTLVFSVLACNLPGSEPTQEFPPTPNATMTELFAQATILTPDLDLPQAITETATPADTATLIPTETPTITLTPEDTLTYTPPPTLTPSIPQRGGTQYVARYLNTAPTLDGDWGEWSTTQYPANSVVYGYGNWENSDDLESAFRVGWDDTYLYIAVKVRDDKYVENATGSDLYKGDSIELLLDVDLYGDFYSTVLSGDDYQLGISPGKGSTSGTREAYLWYPTGQAGSKSNVTIGALSEEGVYRVEFRVPWSVFGVSPSVNKHFGFALSVSDNDDTESNVQQTMVSSASHRTLTNPTTWGELVLGY